MSFLSKAPISATPQQLNSINVDRSRYGDAIPLVYGMQRIPVTLGWYGAFTQLAQTSNTGKGGGSSQITGWNYTASVVMMLCEGPLPLSPYVRAVWKDKSITTYQNLGLFFFGGGLGPAPWSYLTSNFPGQDDSYPLTAYFGAENLPLGSSAALPNFTFEVMGLLCPGPAHTVTLTAAPAAGATSCVISGASPVADGTYNVGFSDFETRRAQFVTVSGTTTVSWDSQWGLTSAVTTTMTIGGYDVEPSAILVDYSTNVNHGCNFNYLNTSQIQTHSYVVSSVTYFDSYKVYCEANGLYISPWEDTQRSASGFFQDILELTNSDCFMSGGVLNIVPYGDTVVTGNGVTYTPNLQPQFAFNDDDYRLQPSGKISDPVVLTQKPLSQTYNTVRVEFYDRGNNYNAAIAEWSDPVDIAENGKRVMPTKTFHAITNAATAYQVAALIGQRQLYIVNTYTFAVRADLYSLLEPMDFIAITDSSLGVEDLLLRVVQIEDDADDTFIITAEDPQVGTASAPVFNLQDAQGFYANYDVLPPACAAPVVLSVPPSLAGPSGGYRMGLAIGPASPTGAQQSVYGGCQVMLSMDDLTWTPMGTVNGSARFGTVTAGHAISASTPGAADTFYFTMAPEVYAEGYQLDSATAADFAANRSLFWVDEEIVAFETVTLLSAANYSVTVTRGLFGTGAPAHAAGSNWARLDAEIFQFDFDPGMIGQTVYFELYSFNDVGAQLATSPTTGSFVIQNFNSSQLIGGPLNFTGNGCGFNANSVFCVLGSGTNWFSTIQSYVNGVFIEFTPADHNESVCGLSTAGPRTPLTTDNFAYFTLGGGTLGWAEQNVGTATSFTSGNFSTYAAGDVLRLSFDGNYLRYFQNGTLLRQTSVSAPNIKIYGWGSFSVTAPNGTTLKNIVFGPAGISSPVVFGQRGACLAANRVLAKVGGIADWDSDCYSINGYPTCNLNLKCAQTTANIFAGLVLEPISNWAGPSNWMSVNFGFFINGSGIWGVGESGSIIGGVGGSYDTTTLFSITWDGSTLNYLVNNVSVRSVSVSAPHAFADICFYDPGGVLTPVDFGPGPAIPTIDTAQIGLNAATDYVNLFGAGPQNATAATVAAAGGTQVMATVTVPAQTFGYTALIILDYDVTFSGPGGSDTDEARFTTNSVTTAFNMARALLNGGAGQPPTRTTIKQEVVVLAGKSLVLDIVCTAVGGGVTAAFTNMALLGTILYR